MFRLNTEEGVGRFVERVVAEDEKITTKGHRRRIARQGKHGVVHAVPITNERINKIENEDQPDQSWN